MFGIELISDNSSWFSSLSYFLFRSSDCVVSFIKFDISFSMISHTLTPTATQVQDDRRSIAAFVYNLAVCVAAAFYEFASKSSFEFRLSKPFTDAVYFSWGDFAYAVFTHQCLATTSRNRCYWRPTDHPVAFFDCGWWRHLPISKINANISSLNSFLSSMIFAGGKRRDEDHNPNRDQGLGAESRVNLAGDASRFIKTNSNSLEFAWNFPKTRPKLKLEKIHQPTGHIKIYLILQKSFKLNIHCDNAVIE